jgi:PAS domain S-box-containing protein
MPHNAQARLTVLAEAADTLLCSLDAAVIVPAIVDLAQRLLRADAYAVWRRFPEEQLWRVTADRSLSPGYSRVQADPDNTVPPGPVFVEDVTTDAFLASRREALAAEGVRSMLVTPLRIRGESTGTIVFYWRDPHPRDEAELRAAGALANLAAAALTNADLYAEERRMRARAERSSQQLQFLAEASAVLSASLDYETTLDHLARLAVPHIADWCTVHLREEDGSVRLVAVAHADPARAERAREFSRRYPPDLDAERGFAIVLRTGQPELYPEITEQMLAARAHDAEHLALLKRVGFTSILFVPLRARDRTSGVLTLVSAESGIRYTEEDLRLAEELAGRAAVAIENARLYARVVENEERFRMVSEALPQVVWLTSADGRFRQLNRHWYEYTGLSEAEMLEGTGFARVVHPDDWQRIQREWELSRAAGREFQFEYRLRRAADGAYRWHVGRVLPVRNGRGELERWVGIAVDVDDLKATQARLEAALAAGRMCFWEWNIATGRVTRSANAAEVLGTNPPGFDEFVAMVHPEDRERVTATLSGTLEGASGHAMELRVVWPDGSVRWLQDSAVLQRGADGAPERLAGVCVDITERKEAEEALRAADRRKDEFLAVLAHELRTPLAPILNVAQIQKMAGTDDRLQARHQETIERNAQHLSRMVEDLVDISRINQDKLELRKQRVELAGLVEQAVASARPAFERRGQELTVSIPPEPVHLDADPTRLVQVLANLLTNASKYTPEGGRAALAVACERGEAVIYVRDEGRGIDAGLLPRIFDPFVQADQSIAREEGGLGIGLTLVKRLVELHGGTVCARSDGPGRGSEFTVRLPAEAAAPPAEVPARRPLPVADEVPRRRVLIVEDNVDAAETLADLLDLWGQEVRAVHDGELALGLASSFDPDLILLDIGLPGMDGYEVARRLRGAGLTRAHLVALSGYSHAEHRSRVAECGFDRQLTKPVEPEVLREALRAAERVDS